jgi:adenine-specific DNA-methyltransferase
MAKKKPMSVDSLRHKDKRTNIPTEELRDFVAEDEHAPKTMLYARDPSLDPQLVWKGKDEQDRADLAVPVVPIYIQEKIHPQAIIDALPRIEKAGDDQPNLFADFNGGPADFDKKIDFYHYPQNWTNRLILGDSLLVMTSLAEKEGLKGKVQTIYLDPPYGIKFGSNWQVSTRKRDVKDGKAEDATRQPEQVRAFRDTWKLGVHSYLAYLRDRLVVARDLLTETGSVFVQIGDENVHLVRCVMDEVFGADKFVSLITVKKTGGQSRNELPGVCDYLVWYAKRGDSLKYRQLYFDKDPGQEGARQYNWIETLQGERRVMSREEEEKPESIRGQILQPYPLVSIGVSQTDRPFKWKGKEFRPSPNRRWSVTAKGLEKIAAGDRLLAIGNTLRFVNYLKDYPVTPYTNLWTDTQTSGFASDRLYVVQTLPIIIQRCLLMTTDPGDLVLDLTCGSGTTAYVAEQWGRRWITCDTSRVALALARTRLMGAKYPYYLLADSPEGVKKEAELTSKHPPEYKTEGDIRKGFVYKRVPHVTLKSIANNPDVKEGMTRQQIDAAIAKHADVETLFDQPYEDNKRVRVCGPFSVESLSPHRTISIEEKKRNAETGTKHGFTMRVIGPDNFGHTILENLKKAGVQNTRKGERLKFDSVDVYPGEWIHGVGVYQEINPQITQINADSDKNNLRKSAQSADSVLRRAAICIDPEHGTVGATLIKEAAKEAVKGIGFDVLIVCGFAFDPSVSEEAKRYGKLIVLPTKMNPDLAMGDELLKKTGAGNLFMVFGEPDVEIRRIHPQIPQINADSNKKNLRKSAKSADNAGEQVVVEIKGVEVYDPTTGAIRNSSTDDIACWFIDSNYNGESFFVRHAYFTGADEPYDKLKRALRAEIDEAAWSSLYSTVSRPFDKPESGKIAVKVINHYGDEVLKVYTIEAK